MGSFKTKDQPREAIEAFIRKHNEHAKPFRWRKREVKAAIFEIQLLIYAIEHWLRGENVQLVSGLLKQVTA